jgi:anti-sigma factor RsiW
MKIECSTRNDVPRAHLNAYVDGELPAAKRQALERLLVTNVAARSQLADLAEMRALVRRAYGAAMTK